MQPEYRCTFVTPAGDISVLVNGDFQITDHFTYDNMGAAVFQLFESGNFAILFRGMICEGF